MLPFSQLMGIEHRQSSRPATGRLEVSDLEDRQLLSCLWEDMGTTSLWAVGIVSRILLRAPNLRVLRGSRQNAKHREQQAPCSFEQQGVASVGSQHGL